MENRSHEAFNDSLQRTAPDPFFLTRFYRLVLASSPEIRTKFDGIDMARQRSMLKASLYMLLLGARDRPEGLAHLREIAHRHGAQGLTIPDRLYDLWLESLLQAVADLDPELDDDVKAAWGDVLSYGVAVMKQQAREA